MRIWRPPPVGRVDPRADAVLQCGPPRAAVLNSGDVAQLGERLVRNEEVSGSIPLISTR